MLSLTNLHIRVERARDRIRAIEGHLKAWPQDDAHGVGLEARYDEAASQLVLVVSKPPPPDPTLSSLVGEALHHLRSSLDHLVYQLVVARTTTAPDFNSAFPIVGRGKNVKGTRRTAAEVFDHQTNRLRNAISPTALARIHSLQPFQRGAAFDMHPLWLLNELNIADKHRSPIVAQTFVGLRRGSEAHFKFLNGPRTKRGPGGMWLNIGAQLTPGTELVRITTMKPTSKVELVGGLSITPAIKVHSNGRHEKVTEFLKGLSDYIEQTINSFNDEFGQSPSAPPPHADETGLSVSPASVVLWADGQRHEAYFEVANLSQEHKYAVYVQVTASEVGSSSQDMVILLDEDPNAPRVMTGPIEISLDAFIIDLEDDYGKVFSLLGFHGLAPGARRRVELRAKVGVEQNLSAEVTVVAFSSEPEPIIASGNQAQFGFKVPVSGSLVAVRNRQRQITGGAGTLRVRVNELEPRRGK
ncbi:MAG: hypothetical protein AB7H81_12375 [Vicinamibacterales bacterium]